MNTSVSIMYCTSHTQLRWGSCAMCSDPHLWLIHTSYCQPRVNTSENPLKRNGNAIIQYWLQTFEWEAWCSMATVHFPFNLSCAKKKRHRANQITFHVEYFLRAIWRTLSCCTCASPGGIDLLLSIKGNRVAQFNIFADGYCWREGDQTASSVHNRELL